MAIISHRLKSKTTLNFGWKDAADSALDLARGVGGLIENWGQRQTDKGCVLGSRIPEPAWESVVLGRRDSLPSARASHCSRRPKTPNPGGQLKCQRSNLCRTMVCEDAIPLKAGDKSSAELGLCVCSRAFCNLADPGLALWPRMTLLGGRCLLGQRMTGDTARAGPRVTMSQPIRRHVGKVKKRSPRTTIYKAVHGAKDFCSVVCIFARWTTSRPNFPERSIYRSLGGSLEGCPLIQPNEQANLFIFF